MYTLRGQPPNYSAMIYILAVAQVLLPEHTFVEDHPQFDLCFSITNNVTIDISLLLNLQTEEGTATLLDFELVNSEVLINGSMCYANIITIFPDGFLEINETFSITITSLNSQLLAENSRTDIIIIDTDSEFK